MKHVLNEALHSIEQSGIRRISDEASKYEGVIRLTVGEPAFNTPENIKQAAKDALDQNHTHYPSAIGLLPLRKAIAQFEATYNHIHYQPEEIIITHGATGALYVALGTILNPGDEVIIFSPAYTSYRPAIEIYGGKVIEIDLSLTDFQLDDQILRRAISEKTKAILINSPNNPTGVILNKESLDILEHLIEDIDVYVICDDVYNQLSPRKSEYFVQRTKHKAKIIYCQSLSKPYAMTGWRIGYVMAEQQLAHQIVKLQQYSAAGVAPFVQLAAIEALKTNVQPMLDFYQKQRVMAQSMLDEVGIPYIESFGAFYLVIDISKSGLDSWSFAYRLLEEKQVAVVPGAVFASSFDHYVRLSLAASQEDVTVGIAKIIEFIRQRGG